MIKMRKADDKTTGGLFVPTGEVAVPKEGSVVLAGPGRTNPQNGDMMECPVKVGDLVLLSEYTGEKIDYNNEQHIFCDADSLLGSFSGGSPTADAFNPLGDLIMVEMAEQETSTTTGIALAGLEEEESNSGKVVKVGPGRYAANGKLVAPTVTPGESVMFGRCVCARCDCVCAACVRALRAQGSWGGGLRAHRAVATAASQPSVPLQPLSWPLRLRTAP